MSYQKERDQFIAVCVANGLTVDDARAFLRMATTADRLAVAQCNGDWPADNGERQIKTCPDCEIGWAPSSFRAGVCPDCRLTARIEARAEACNIKVLVNGDPRGFVVKLILPSGSYNSWGGPEHGWGVPTR